jgi:hypothetical protein
LQCHVPELPSPFSAQVRLSTSLFFRLLLFSKFSAGFLVALRSAADRFLLDRFLFRLLVALSRVQVWLEYSSGQRINSQELNLDVISGLRVLCLQPALS